MDHTAARALVEQALYGVDLDRAGPAEVAFCAQRLIEQRAVGEPVAAYLDAVETLLADVEPSSAADEERRREFLARLRDELRHRRPWPEPPFRSRRLAGHTELLAAPVVLRAETSPLQLYGPLHGMFEPTGDGRLALVLEVTGGPTVAFVAPDAMRATSVDVHAHDVDAPTFARWLCDVTGVDARPVTAPYPRRVSAADFTGVVALDGPSGTGKSTVARRLAARLGAHYLDTGAMYRAATVAALRAGAALDDAVAVTRAVEDARIEISTDPEAASVRLDGTAVDADIRSAETTAAVSAVSAVPAVRAILVAAQRELIGDGGFVVEGRDIGTVVWPTAAPKVYLTASPEARAERRAGELNATDVAAVAGDIARRDGLDSSRAASPLVRAEDAVELDTTELSIDQVVDRLAELAAG